MADWIPACAGRTNIYGSIPHTRESGYPVARWLTGFPPSREGRTSTVPFVIPAKAGIQWFSGRLDSRLRGKDEHLRFPSSYPRKRVSSGSVVDWIPAFAGRTNIYGSLRHTRESGYPVVQWQTGFPPSREGRTSTVPFLIPAKAGIQWFSGRLDSRLRGKDENLSWYEFISSAE